MLYGTMEFNDFIDFVRSMGYNDIDLSKSPYEVYRGIRKLPDGSKDIVVIYKKSNGTISMAKQNSHLMELFYKQQERRGYTKGNREQVKTNAKKDAERDSLDAFWEEACTLAEEISSCTTRDQKERILAGVSSLRVLKEVAILLSESL